MKIIGVLVAAAMLAGCSLSSQPPMTAPLRVSSNAAAKDLVYVSDYDAVKVYDYETDTLIATLSYFAHAAGSCTDASGNVYIANYGDADVVEFSHDGTKPKYIVDPSAYPEDCSIDRTTGDLAVINEYGTSENSPGTVAVYAGGKGKPKVYKSPFSVPLVSGAYDASGNLLVGGYSNTTIDFAFLPAGKGQLEGVSLPMQSDWYGPAYVRWDGEYFVASFRTEYVDEPGIFVMYTIKGTSGEREGYTLAEDSGGSAPFWLGKIGGAKSLQRANTMIVCGQNSYSGLSYYYYPKGGTPIYNLDDLEQTGGVTVSP